MRTLRSMRLFLIAALMAAGTATARAELLVGTASTDITPDLPVAVSGQFALRIAREVESPVTANVIALESRQGGQTSDAAVLVSCDLVYIDDPVLQAVRAEVAQRLPELSPERITMFATHTHTAPVTREGKYAIPSKGVTQVSQYLKFLSSRVADAIEEAWKRREAGAVSWGLSDAVVGYNRRAVYADGRAQMYGRTDTPNFRGLEGYEDHDINTLFFWNRAGVLVGVLVNVACPSQEVESRRTVNADFWHPVRQSLQAKYGNQLVVLGSTSAAGDQSPHLMYRKAADERMRELRGLTRLEEIARRIVRAVNEAYEVVRQDQHDDPALIHRSQVLHLPMRKVTEPEYAAAKAEVDKAAAEIRRDPQAAARLQMRMKWYGDVVQRYEQQQQNPSATCDTEIHVLRIGDTAVCTNRFELFTDFGICIKARSKAVQTIVIQLAGPGTYLATERAIQGGHYSAIIESTLVGPEGGHQLVDRTVQLIDSVW